MGKREEYQEQVRDRLKELEIEIDRLKAMIKDAESELSPEHYRRMEKIQELKDKARKKFNELVAAGDDAWEHLRAGMDQYWTSLGNEVKAYEGFAEK